jgi:DNA repair exonuclease SbcCD nuclease subunit
MKLAIISDLHFGFGAGTEREEDAFSAAAEAFEKAKDADLIILGGDIFDSRDPDADILSRSMEILQKPLLEKASGAKLAGFVGGKMHDSVSRMSLLGIPVVSIHGTHERRAKGLINPVQALEKAGFVIHIHCNGVIFEKKGEKVCVQGLSGVPDQYAETVLKEWDPKPVEGCYNIFVLHQSVTEFLYAEHTLDLEKIPKGFDVYVNGHIHESDKSLYGGKPFLIAGSLIPTQLRKEESGKAKCFWKFDTKTGEWEQVFLTGQRGFYFIEFKGHEAFESEMRRIITENLGLKPIVKVSFPKEAGNSVVSEVESKYREGVILSVKKEVIEERRFEAKTLEEHKLSVEELGRRLLAENLGRAGLDPGVFDQVFELLAAGKADEAMGLMKKAAEPKPVLKHTETRKEPEHNAPEYPGQARPRARQKTVFG